MTDQPPTVVNPQAVGDPNQTPIVRLWPATQPTADLRTPPDDTGTQYAGLTDMERAAAMADGHMSTCDVPTIDECGVCLYRIARIRTYLAAVLPAHRAMVLAEAAEAIETEVALNWRGAVRIVRGLAATGPTTGPAPTPPGQDGPAVPEEPVRRSAGCDDCDEVCTERCGCPGCTAPEGPGRACRKCGAPLVPCAVCGEPASCGDSRCGDSRCGDCTLDDEGYEPLVADEGWREEREIVPDCGHDPVAFATELRERIATNLANAQPMLTIGGTGPFPVPGAYLTIERAAQIARGQLADPAWDAVVAEMKRRAAEPAEPDDPEDVRAWPYRQANEKLWAENERQAAELARLRLYVKTMDDMALEHANDGQPLPSVMAAELAQARADIERLTRERDEARLSRDRTRDFATVLGYELGAEDLQGAEAERDRIARELARMAGDLQDARITLSLTEQERLWNRKAYEQARDTVRRYQPVIDAAKAWRAQFTKPHDTKYPRQGALIVAVDALGDAGQDDDFRCTCDPNGLFDPPDPRPRAVAGCPAHRARRAAQQAIERSLAEDAGQDPAVGESGSNVGDGHG